MLNKIGIGIVLLGAMMGDSDSLIIPLGLITMGTVLFLIGKLVECNE